MSIKDSLDDAISKLELLRQHKSPEVRLMENIEVVCEEWFEDQSGEPTDVDRPRMVSEAILRNMDTMPSNAEARFCFVFALIAPVYQDTGYAMLPLASDLVDEINEWEEGADLPSLPRSINA